MTKEWEAKTAKSPFRVNLLAENERLDEEHRMRMAAEAKRPELWSGRKQKPKMRSY